MSGKNRPGYMRLVQISLGYIMLDLVRPGYIR
jgi:hypothetical protein